jgi:hypothetical protein
MHVISPSLYLVQNELLFIALALASDHALVSMVFVKFSTTSTSESIIMGNHAPRQAKFRRDTFDQPDR